MDKDKMEADLAQAQSNLQSIVSQIRSHQEQLVQLQEEALRLDGIIRYLYGLLNPEMPEGEKQKVD